jgi:type I restriction enzyme S subunit
MNNNSLTPRIRFKGFTDPWEQRKFEELYEFASEGGTPSTQNIEYYLNGDIPFVKIEETNQKYIFNAKTYITLKGLEYSSAWLVPENSVIFTNGATVGNVAINRVKVATKQGIIGIIPNNKIHYEFMYYLLSSPVFQRNVQNRIARGTFDTIILKNLNNIPTFLTTNLDEQINISSILGKIDSLITLHQRKHSNVSKFF